MGMLLRQYHNVDQTQAESTPKKVEDMTKAELIEHAEANGIDLGDAKTKVEILAVVQS